MSRGISHPRGHDVANQARWRPPGARRFAARRRVCLGAGSGRTRSDGPSPLCRRRPATSGWYHPKTIGRLEPCATYQPLVNGVARFQAGNYSAAISLLDRPALATTTLADYATYYIGLSQLRQGQAAEARRTFEKILDKKPNGHIAVAAAIGAGEAAEATGDAAAAVKFYERVVDHKGAITEEVLVRLGRAALRRAIGKNQRNHTSASTTSSR